MAKSATTQASKKSSALELVLSIIFKPVLILLASGVMALLITVALMLYFGTAGGFHLVVQAIQAQLLWLSHLTVLPIGDQFLTYAFEAIHLVQGIPTEVHLATYLAGSSDPFSKAMTASGTFTFSSLLQVIRLVSQLILARAISLVLFLPLFLLVGVMALSDGLVQRTLRRQRGGRESALIYHKTKSLSGSLLGIGVFFYLVIPYPLPSTLIILPGIGLVCLLFWLSVKTFKKYL